MSIDCRSHELRPCGGNVQRRRHHESEDDVRVADGRPATMTAAEMLKILEEEGFIGMWKDREDIGDSVEFARKLRDEGERRGDAQR